MKHTTLVPVCLVALLLTSRPAQAQWLVYDPAAWAKLVEQVEQGRKLIEDAKKTSTSLTTPLSGLGSFRTTPIQPSTWDTPGSMAPTRIPQIEDAVSIVAAMPAGAQRQYWEQQLAMLFVGARSSSHAMKQGLAVQSDASGPLANVINALTSSVLSGSTADHSVAAILDRIAIGASVHAHQLDNLGNVLVGLVNQAGVAQQRTQNTETEQLNIGLTMASQAVAAGRSYTKGSSDVLRTWRFH